jgi:hypothetical protein
MDALKAVINWLCQPEPLITISCIVFFAVFIKLEIFAKWQSLVVMMGGIVIYTLASAGDENFRLILTKPDNVPIVIIFLLLPFFFWLWAHQAVDNDTRTAEGRPLREIDVEPKVVYVWPHLVYTELICIVVMTLALIVWSVAIDAPIEEPANPAKTPNPSKAPWYFLGLQEMLVYFDPWLAGVVFPSLIVVGLMAIPYMDKNPKGNGYYTFKERPFAIMTFCFGFFILWILLVFLGTFLRGPNWNFFGPYEYWDSHKVVPLVNVNLSEYFWIKGLSQRLPENIFLREAPGFVLVGAYMFILPFVMAKTVFKSFFNQMGFIRFNVFAMLFLSMMSMPIKMILRWTVNLKYLVAIPEYFFNI